MRATLVCLALASTAGCGWFGEGARVARQELGPAALLKKYESFKDMAAALDARRADVELYEKRVEDAKKRLDGVPVKEIPRAEVERLALMEQELAGLKMSYNSLAANYNANMAKENWKFCNAGDLPPGADRPLPREYRSYITK